MISSSPPFPSGRQRSATPKGGTSTTPVSSRKTGVRRFSRPVIPRSAKSDFSVLVQPRCARRKRSPGRGEEKEIFVTALDASGNAIDGFDYRVEYDFADGAASVASQSGNTITLRAAEDRSFIGKCITIHAISDTLGSEAEMSVRIVDW